MNATGLRVKINRVMPVENERTREALTRLLSSTARLNVIEIQYVFRIIKEIVKREKVIYFSYETW